MGGVEQILLDSGPHSRLYDLVMGTIHHFGSNPMQIGEVAKRASLTVDAIRFYERRRLLPRAERTAGRFRLYTEEAIERLAVHPAKAKPGLLAEASWRIAQVAREEGGRLRIRERVAAVEAR